jgi:CarboxypepD_reg-like domain/Secretion system C-terminal sorting domain/von Willebrand factor type A domain
MKIFTLLLCVAFGLVSPSLFISKNVVEKIPALVGKITDGSTGEALIGASISVSQTGKIISGAISNLDGNYQIDSLAEGEYSVLVAFVGYESARFPKLFIKKGEKTVLDVALNAGAILEEVVVVGSSAREKRSISSSVAKMSGAVSGIFSGKTTAAPAAASMKPDMPAEYESKPMTKPATAVKKDTKSGDVADDLAKKATKPFDSEIESNETILPRAGLLTAGEWNDLNNWGKHWVDLLADGELAPFEKKWECSPKNRFTFLLTNKNDFPLVDAVVKMFDQKGALVWETRTDNRGKAECWASFFNEKMPESLVAQAIFNGKVAPLGQPISFEKGINRHALDFNCGASKNVDIVFAVDATGSMGDEISYLQTELIDVLGRVQSANPEISLRTGSVFYRDVTDEYLVKSSGLTSDTKKTVDYIKKQAADGGGDWPEAVHSALEEAVFNQKWSESAVARIVFLVLDASPHDDAEVKISLQKSIREAAKKGIRIIPVVASGIQKETEWIMKFMDLATNGSYIFLTDHSGIGGKHLEPTTDEYKVEQFNDLLVRVITEYATVENCDGKSEIRFQNNQNQPNQSEKVLFFPNPASNQFSVELPFDVEVLTLYNAEGKSVRSLKKLSKGTETVRVDDLPEGIYTLRILRGNEWQSGKVMVVRS